MMRGNVYVMIVLAALTVSSCAREHTAKLTIDLSRYFGKPRVTLSGEGFKERWKCDSTRLIVVEARKRGGFFRFERRTEP